MCTVTCPLTHFLSTDYHRYNFLLDYHRFLLGTEIHGFILYKDTAWLRIDKPRHFGITACFASSRLSLLCGNEPCLYFSIALMQIKPFLCAAQPCLF